MADEYLSFEDALKALQIQEAELRALVAQSKLRAFRDGNMLKFRRSDVDALRGQRGADSTVVLQPRADQDTAVPQIVSPPPAEAGGDLLADDGFGFDDTAETLVGAGAAGGGAMGDVELSLEPAPLAAPREPATKVPTVELTPPDTGTEDTQVPTLDLGGAAEPGTTSDTEVPTMVLGLDQYDDTQSATEDVATEEVSLEPGELGEGADEATAPIEGVTPQEEIAEIQPGADMGGPGTGRVTPASALGTGEALFVREQPSALYTVMSALAAFVLVLPGALFFYCVASSKVPDWDFLKSIMGFFWNILGLTPPGTTQ